MKRSQAEDQINAPSERALSMTQPNIVVIMADQLAPQFTGAYGHPIAKTPHLDALAGRGIL